MDNVMQGYNLDAAVRQIGKTIGKAAKAAPTRRKPLRGAPSRRTCAICMKPGCSTTMG